MLGDDEIHENNGEGMKHQISAQFLDDESISRPTDKSSISEVQEEINLERRSDSMDRGRDETEVSRPDKRPPKQGQGIAPKRHMTIQDLSHQSKQLQSQNITYHIMTLPKIVAINPYPYTSTTHQSPIEDEEYSGHVHNMIRWRYASDDSSSNRGFTRDTAGKLKRESNAKIIKWSDGTWGLVVGNEMFDIDEFHCTADDNPNTKKNHKNGRNTKEFLYLSQKADTYFTDITAGETRLNTTGTVLECYAPLSSKFIPRVASLQSTAHKNFVLAERSRNLKRARIAEHTTFVDPEKEKLERIRNKEEVLKQERRSIGRRSTGSVGSGKRDRFLGSRRWVEDEDEGFDSVNISSLKKQMYEDTESEDSGSSQIDEWSKKKRHTKYVSEEDEENHGKDRKDGYSLDGLAEVEEDSDEEDEEVVRKKTNIMKRRDRKIFDDDDE